MTHRQQPHPAGTFPQCPACHREPRHVLDGRSRPTGGHLMACSCGDSAKFDTLADAVAAWCAARNIRNPIRGYEGKVRPIRQLAAVVAP